MADFPGFIGGTYQSVTANEDAQECMNLYCETDESGIGMPGQLQWSPSTPGPGKSPRALIGTPGLSTFITCATSPIRGIWIGENRMFVIAGSKVIEVFSNATQTVLGDVGTDGLPAYIYPNGNQIFIVSAGLAYVSNGGAPTAVNFTTGGAVTALSGAFLDGYFCAVSTTDKHQFFISAINDGLTWNAIDYAVKEGYPDNITALLADHEELWIFGTQTTEVWRNTGAAAFPLERDPGAFVHIGCGAPNSPVRLQNGVGWLGNDPRGQLVAYAAKGFIPVRVSTHAVENAWAQYSVVSDAVSYCYEENGHYFWVINFPTGNATWVYDATEQLWHKRGWWNGTSIDRHRGMFHGFVFNKHFLGDWSTGVIYQASQSLYDDAGTSIHRVRTAPHQSVGVDRIFYERLRIDFENSGAVNPSLSWSNDGAHTFGAQKTTNSQTAGQYARYEWRRLGAARDRVFSVQTTAAVKVAIIGASIDTRPGAQ